MLSGRTEHLAKKPETKKVNDSKPGNDEKDKAEDHTTEEEHSDIKPASVLPNRNKQQALFHVKVLYKWINNQGIPIEYNDKKLELRFTFVSAY